MESFLLSYNQTKTSSPITLALYGTCFTWFVTALGAGLVFLIPTNLSTRDEGIVLDISLGFGGGVMLAASFWSLLDPCIHESEKSGWGNFAWVPATIGLVTGAIFVWLSEVFIPDKDSDLVTVVAAANGNSNHDSTHELSSNHKTSNNNLRQRNRRHDNTRNNKSKSPSSKINISPPSFSSMSQRRIFLLMIAIVLHNFPEGLAVGVQFGVCSVGDLKCIGEAITLAIGIGLQNFPEGLAVSLPLRRLGYSSRQAFFLGQLSGFVEPFGGLFGAGLVTIAKPILPYALAFAAGAMVFVVADSVIPESHERGNGRLASWGLIVGFITMMSLDVGFG
jgi:zinc transporter 11